jgi:hypothetical protein
MPEQQQRQPDARKEDEEKRREHEDRDRERARGQQEPSADHPARSQDPRDVDGEARSIARALAVVALDLASQMAEHERPGRHHQEAEETKSVCEPASEDGAGDEVHESQQDDLLVVCGAAPGAEPDHLKCASELDRELERVSAEKQASDLSDEQSDGQRS